ncbi:hypothetical protein [Clostridioides difficile]|uniref:hypothetical protein n=3 Tax=Clostridioides difficile TaxID=1496 RepID=UPI0003B28F52|nr:hypothetical protein [Clostridioides difficile]CCL55137.1 hypothetical protein BN180_2600018 [Clostridioides difficile E14]HBG4348109.1 hypothetical protein [Clostridioides difficile]HBL8524075.1 hypothetical protein [Clostridioides difficile]
MKVSADDGTLSLNKTAKGLKEIAGITIYKNKDTGELKNMVQLLDELKGKWGELREDEQKGLAEAIAGKQQAAIFQSLMGNYDTFKEIREEFSQGLQFGSAETENKQYLDSLAGRLNELKTIWADIFQTLFNSDMTYGFLDGLISVSNGINTVIKSLDRMKMTLPAMITSFTMLKSLFKGISLTSITTGNQGDSGGSRNQHPLIRFMGKIKQETNNATGAMNKFKAAGREVANVGRQIGNSFKGFAKNVGASLISGFAIGAIISAISMVIRKLDEYNRRYEIASNKHRENIATLESELSTYKNQKSTLSELAEEYDNLANKSGKSIDEWNRFSELKQQIADNMPELVIGYDENGDPILKMNGSCKDLINSLDKAIEKKQELISDENIALGKSSLDELNKVVLNPFDPNWNKEFHLSDDTALENASLSINDAESKIIYSLKKLETSTGEKFKENIKTYKEKSQEYKDTIITENNKVQEASMEIDKKLESVRQGVIGSLNKDKQFKALNESLKQSAYEITSSIDFSGLSDVDVEKYTAGMKKALSDNEIDSCLTKYQELRMELEKTGQYEKYENSIEGIIPELAKLWNVNENTARSMTKVPPSVKSATDAMDAYLQTFGKRSQMQQFDSETRDLIAKYEAFQDLSDSFSNENNFIKVDGKIEYDPEVVTNILNKDNIPKEIKEMIEGLSKDGLSEKDTDMILKMSFAFQLGDTQEGKQMLDEVENEINAELKKQGIDKKVDLGNIKIKADYDVNADDAKEKIKAKIESFKNINAREKVKVKLEAELDNVEQVKVFSDIIANLPANEDITNKFIINNVKELKNLKDYQSVVQWLRDNSMKAMDYDININGLDNFDKLKEEYNNLGEKEKKIFAEVIIKNPDKAKAFQDIYNNAPDGKKKAVINFAIEHTDELEMAASLYNSTQEEQKNQVLNIIVNNADKLNILQDLYSEYPDHKDVITNFLIKNPEALKQFDDWKSLVDSLPIEIKKQLGIEVEGGENAEKTVNTVQNADGTKADLLVNAEVNGESQVVECIETLDKNGNKTYTPNLNPQVNNSEKVVQCMRILDEYGNESYIPIVSPQVTNEEGLNSTKQKMDELDNKTVTSTVQIKTEGETEVEQATNFIENTNPTKVIELSINNSGKDEIDNTKQKLDELNNEKATPTIEATGAEQASKQLNQLSQKAQEIGQGNYHINVSTSTEQGAKNISGLIARVKQFLALKVSTLVFRTETAQAAKNVSGLLAKVQSYVSRYGGKTIKTTFSALTATAAKNISGLIRKIESFKSNYAGKTFTTTFVTNKVTNSSGGGGGGNSSDKTNKTERTSVTNVTPIPANLLAQPRTSEPAPISDETPVTPKPSLFSRAVSRATSAFKVIKPKVTINNDTIDSSVKYSIELFKELENAISAVTNEIALLDKKMEHATGDEKIKYLQEQNKLFAQQKDLIKQQQDGYKAESNRLKNRLKEKKMGFKFDDTGNLTNYEEKLISIEKELDKLNSKSGDKENKKDESRKKELEETKKVLEEYIKVTFTELPKCEQEWEEYNNKIKEHNEELRKAQEEMWKLNKNSTWTSMYKDVEQVNNEIAMIDVLLKNATGDEQIELLEKKKELMAKKAKELSETTAYLQETQKELQQKLQGYGFTFRDNGDITNFIQHKNQLKKNMTDEEFKRMEEAAEGYLDLLINKIPDANKEIAESKEEIEALNKEIQDAYKDQLKEAQSLQEKIRDMYKKELEERLKEIDKETKAKIDSLKKQQDAYNDSRKEAKYKDDYEEQQDVISDLEKQIAIAERDSSLSGQKKLKDLQKQLKEEQKKLQDLVQDHVDDQVNDMYDKESDRLQEEADKLKEELEKKYSDENLVDLINEAISSGKFVGLDGEVKKLQDAIIEYINKYEDGMLAMGSVTKQEWLDKLKEGKETLEDINDILDELDLSKFAMPNYTPPSNSRSRSASPISAVNYNSPFVVVQGNVTKDVMPEFEKKMRKMIEENNKKIISNTRS